ncbi:tail fiber domain-containing protein [Sungkyunkwania multivorans]|uniref:Tail fiber domain-containing protein n=1 Tax=Sungkyunkwania multivorans TaxID=1173618 RepID=A0ABW3CYQ3_9FLAO
MKTTNRQSILFLIIIFFFFLNTNILSAQWRYQSSSITNSIFRYGNVGIGGYPYYKLDVKGSFRCYSLSTTSDKRFKKDIKDIASALTMINELQGVTYMFDRSQQREGESFPEGLNIGLIAQDVKKVLPELVFEDGQGIYSVNYIGIIPILIEATKELNEQLLEKEAQLAEVEERVRRLEEQIIALGKTNTIEATEGYFLEQNRPNPAENSTKIQYRTPLEAKNIALKVFNANGTLIWQRIVHPSFEGEVDIPTNTFKAGVYIYALTIGDRIMTSKKLIVK